MLETEFALANKAPPRSPIMTNHFAEPMPDFNQPVATEPAASSSFMNSEYSDGNGRLRSISSLGFQSADIKGLNSPRFEAPGTPSMISTTLEIPPQRAQSSQTMTSVATRNIDDDADQQSVRYSFSDMSSLSSADEDGSDAGYPDAEHYPIRVEHESDLV